MIDRAIFHRAPLAPDAFAPLPTGAVKPLGYLLAAERAQANGLGGQITRVWDGLRDSAWMGGKGENWERGPYYLDGLIPLAWQLEDEELQNLARRFVDWILASQDEEGFFGPKDNPDWWPRMIVLKALQQYFTITGDKKILVFLTKYFAYMARKLDEQPLGLWAIARAGDCVDAILWLYDITGKAGLLKLCDKVLGQAMDWTRHFHTFPDEQDQKRAHPWSMLEPRLKATDDPWSEAWQIHQRTHVVNLAMALKTPQVEHALHGGTKQADAFRAGWEKLTRFHGVANGMFTGDEHLSGANPSQGTETCAVVETLYSLERVLAMTGEARVGDLWERIAYNALPAALSPDGWAHQYDQQVNQIRIDRYPRAWYNNKPDANVFGLEPNYGCCTANLHQGYPKFTAHLWMAVRGGGLAAQSYAPCEVLWRAGQTRIRLTVGGDYPTQERVRIRLKMEGEARFPILLRIPGWAEGAHAEVAGERLEGTPGQYLRLERRRRDRADPPHAGANREVAPPDPGRLPRAGALRPARAGQVGVQGGDAPVRPLGGAAGALELCARAGRGLCRRGRRGPHRLLGRPLPGLGREGRLGGRSARAPAAGRRAGGADFARSLCAGAAARRPVPLGEKRITREPQNFRKEGYAYELEDRYHRLWRNGPLARDQRLQDRGRGLCRGLRRG